MPSFDRNTRRRALGALVLALSAAGLSACAPLVLGAAAGSTAAVAADRRSAATQTIDRGLQLEADGTLDVKLGQRANVGASVFNRRVLLTGETRTEEDKQLAEQIAKSLENARDVINEIVVGPLNSVSGRVQDTYLTSRVKAALIVTEKVPSNSMRVVTANGTVYLMGLVTEAEAKIATDVVAGTSGVRRVVKLFEYLSEDERKALEKKAAEHANPPGTDAVGR